MTLHTATIIEDETLRGYPNGAYVALADNAMPVHFIESYSTTAEALAAWPHLVWQEVTDEMREADEIAGDVLFIAEWVS